ncbi:unnamed protein product [Onchocerca flexuosa]|uniref:Uncharacterized protein n=1 Tax=Onchocerca flexuosa TaxID=387005 RepID=A0A183HX74_9BILA|nr:unnamed protein product [Onchocerca flexuosa]
MVQMNNTECEEGRDNALSIDLLPKIRPKSYSFMSSKDVIFKKNIKCAKEEIGKDSEISKSISFGKTSSLANLSNRPKTSSFLRDLRKLFSRSKTSINASTITTTTTSTLTREIKSQDSIIMRNGMENLNNFDIELREKSRSRSWSHYETQGIFHKNRKPVESKPVGKRIYSSIRALRKNKSVELMNEVVTEDTENKSSIHSKVIIHLSCKHYFYFFINIQKYIKQKKERV